MVCLRQGQPRRVLAVDSIYLAHLSKEGKPSGSLCLAVRWEGKTGRLDLAYWLFILVSWLGSVTRGSVEKPTIHLILNNLAVDAEWGWEDIG